MQETILTVSKRHEEARRRADALYEFFVTPHIAFRLNIVDTIRRYYETRFAVELANPKNVELRELMGEFAHAMDASVLGRRMQSALCIFGILTQPRIKEYFCSRPPASPTDTDFCRVDRAAFVHWETQQIGQLEPGLLSGDLNIVQWVNQAVVMYILYLGALPTTETAGRNRPRTLRVRQAN